MILSYLIYLSYFLRGLEPPPFFLPHAIATMASSDESSSDELFIDEFVDAQPRGLAEQQIGDGRVRAARVLREKALIDGVFAALRPPDDAADLSVGQEAADLGQPRPQPSQRRRATEQQPSLSLEELLFRPDYQECIAKHIISRATLYSLFCTCKRLRDALWRGQVTRPLFLT
jgi:hypothetical protein